MGIVAKQSILNTIYTYIGFVFGALNTLFLFTHIFPKAEYGLVTYLLTASNLLWPVLLMGTNNTLTKFYYHFKTEKEQHIFFSWLLVVPLIIIFCIVVLYCFMYKNILNYFLSSNSIVAPYVWAIMLLGVFNAYFELLYTWTKVHLQSIRGNFVKTIFLRLIISVLLLLAYCNILTISQFIYTLCLASALRVLIMYRIAYLAKKFKFDLKKINHSTPLFTYSILVLITSIVAVYLVDLDKVMIEYYLPIEKLPSYSICIYISSVIAVPTRALLQITTPLSAKLLAKQNFKQLDSLNKKSSLNGLIVSGFIALLITSNSLSIFKLVPNNYELFIEIVLYLAVIRVFDASLGVTNSILLNSDAYRWVLFFGIGVLGLAFFLNLIFIPNNGIVGAALATGISYAFFNCIKLIFVYLKFGLQPYQTKSIGVLLLIISLGTLLHFIPLETFSPILSILIKGCITTITFGTLAYKLHLSDDITNGIYSLLNFLSTKLF